MKCKILDLAKINDLQVIVTHLGIIWIIGYITIFVNAGMLGV